MLSRLFNAHGQLCASHPWEVLVATATVTTSLVYGSLWATNRQVSGWSYVYSNEEELRRADFIILSITRCLAVMYLYLQLRNLRKLGSKYLFGLAGMLSLFSSFIFSIAIATIVGFDLNGLNEALPFFLLLVDLSKASALARFTLDAASQDELQKNIGRGMAIIGPAFSLDALVETLAIGVGALSGVKQLETMCCCACLSVIANYLAFMTFYPACLSLILEVTRGHSHGRPLQQLQQLAKSWQEGNKLNPLNQHVKVIMSIGLAFVHIQSRFAAVKLDASDAGVGSVQPLGLQHTQAQLPHWQLYVGRVQSCSLDYGLALALAAILAVKYIFLDSWLDLEEHRLMKEPLVEDSRCKASTGESSLLEHISSIASQQLVADTGKQNGRVKEQKPLFVLGAPDVDDGSSEEENKENIGSSYNHKETQTDGGDTCCDQQEANSQHGPGRSKLDSRLLKECLAILNSDLGAKALTDEEIKMLVKLKHIPSYKLEHILGSHIRGVDIRRQMLVEGLPSKAALDGLPFMNYDYKYVDGACCENVIGYMPVPVGVAGPLLLDGVCYHVPMATTEGCLVASTNRGCRVLHASGGVASSVISDGMTRGPVVRFPTASKASNVKLWLEKLDNFNLVKKCFDTTSRFARLKKVHIGQAGRSLYIRFVSTTGDAMGMNMLSKGTEKSLNFMMNVFPDMEIISLSGNYCTDKKAAAINWIEGRGKSVVCEAVVKAHVVKDILKTTVPALIDLNISKNLVGSAMAGSIGGFNAHASNVVTAIYIATGQDPAQNVTSSNCMLLMEATGPLNEDLHISCTMPSIEVGTVGGGTVLPAQAACLEMLGVRGSNPDKPGDHAKRFARIICATVMAGELSLMSALAAGHLVKSHLKHNRSTINMHPSVCSQPPRTTTI